MDFVYAKNVLQEVPRSVEQMKWPWWDGKWPWEWGRVDHQRDHWILEAPRAPRDWGPKPAPCRRESAAQLEEVTRQTNQTPKPKRAPGSPPPAGSGAGARGPPMAGPGWAPPPPPAAGPGPGPSRLRRAMSPDTEDDLTEPEAEEEEEVAAPPAGRGHPRAMAPAVRSPLGVPSPDPSPEGAALLRISPPGERPAAGPPPPLRAAAATATATAAATAGGLGSLGPGVDSFRSPLAAPSPGAGSPGRGGGPPSPSRELTARMETTAERLARRFSQAAAPPPPAGKGKAPLAPLALLAAGPTSGLTLGSTSGSTSGSGELEGRLAAMTRVVGELRASNGALAAEVEVQRMEMAGMEGDLDLADETITLLDQWRRLAHKFEASCVLRAQGG